ncbi:MAG TPA: energy transducer TonB [Opitutaceae bacterium]|nr:energy transducer TonB [Opitutaceae bacterium]
MKLHVLVMVFGVLVSAYATNDRADDWAKSTRDAYAVSVKIVGIYPVDVVQRPIVLHSILPEYPDALRFFGEEVAAKVWFDVGADGKVVKCDMKISSDKLRDAVASAAKQWRFSAALDVQGRPMASIVVYEFRFAPLDSAPGRFSNPERIGRKGAIPVLPPR